MPLKATVVCNNLIYKLFEKRLNFPVLLSYLHFTTTVRYSRYRLRRFTQLSRDIYIYTSSVAFTTRRKNLLGARCAAGIFE